MTSANGTFTAEVPELRRRVAPALERDHARARRRSRPSEARARRPARVAAALVGVAAARARGRLRDRHGGRGPAPLQPASRRRPRSPPGSSWASTSCASTRAGGRSRRRHAAQRKPAGFDAARPRRPAATTGPRSTTRSRMVRAPGMRVMLTITGPGPAVGEQPSRASATRAGCRAPTAYADFARAVADALHAPGRPLPDLERAQPAGLAAAAVGVRQRRRNCTPVSPHVYRSLVRAAAPAIHAADPGAEVVIGELAPIGNPPISANTPIKPLPFLREMGCVDEQLQDGAQPGAARASRPPQADSFGYHPHPLLQRAGQAEPGHRRGAVRRPHAAVHACSTGCAPRKRLRVSRNIHLTEFGYQTSPPDPAVGHRARRCRRATCSRRPTSPGSTKRVRGLSFYQWDDEPVVNRGSGDQALLGLADRPALQQRQAQAGALDDSRRRS